MKLTTPAKIVFAFVFLLALVALAYVEYTTRQEVKNLQNRPAEKVFVQVVVTPTPTVTATPTATFRYVTLPVYPKK